MNKKEFKQKSMRITCCRGLASEYGQYVNTMTELFPVTRNSFLLFFLY